jgi:hypothetical protein
MSGFCKCHEHFWFNWVQRDSTQETLISENRILIQTNPHDTFLWILMPVSTTLASQELLKPSPKSCLPCLSQWGGMYLRPRWSSQLPSLQVQFHGSPATSSVCQEKGHAHKWQLPPRQGLRQTLTMWSPMGKEASKALGSGLSLYTLWWPHHYCYLHCHLRVGVQACQPVTLWLASK